MLVNVTLKRFWGGRMVGPDTPHPRIEYNGDPEKMPRGFEIVTDAMAASEDAATEALRKAKIRASEEGISLQEALNPRGDLPVSGGVDQAIVEAVKSVKVPIDAPKKSGVKLEDVDNKPAESAESPEKKGKRKKKEQALAEANDKVES